MITRDDVARRAGVSPSTVSYVINGGPRPVSQATREKVLHAIAELGYRPNAVARSLRRQRTSILGLIIPDIINPYFAQVAQGIEAAAFERDFTVVFCHTNYSLQQELTYIDHLYVERAAGVIWIPATGDPKPAQKLMQYGISTVVVDREIEKYSFPSVVADNFRGGFMATEYLISLGHERIGCIVRPVKLSHSQNRLQGYLAALKAHNLPEDERLIASGGYRLENGYHAMLELLNINPPPTAVFTYNDIMAIGAMRALKEKGINVPQDFSVIGFDDIPEAAYACPALTTIRQEKYEMGAQSVALLQRLINGERFDTAPKIVVGVDLIVRESTNPKR